MYIYYNTDMLCGQVSICMYYIYGMRVHVECVYCGDSTMPG